MNLSSTLILTAAVTPAIILLAYILIRDRHHPEPFKQIAKGFGFGCISVAIVLTVIGIPHELGLFPFDLPTVSNSIANAFSSLPSQKKRLRCLCYGCYYAKTHSSMNEWMELYMPSVLEWALPQRKTSYTFIPMQIHG